MTSDSTNARPPLQTSAHYGIASIAIAGIFIITAVLAVQLADTLQQSGYKGFTSSDLRTAAYGGYIGATLLILASLGAAVTAIQGLRVADRCEERGILSIAGLLLSLISALLWFRCFNVWHVQIADAHIFQ